MNFVTGAARSGTTLITRMFEACGANLGDVGTLAENNTFKRKHLKPYLTSIGADPLGIEPLPDPNGHFPAMQFDTDADLIKDPKLALIWKALPEAKWIFVYRDIEKIAESCLRTSFLSDKKTQSGWEEWALEYQDRCDAIPNAMTIVTQDVIDDVDNLKDAVEWLGYEFDANAVKRCIKKSKWQGG